LKANKNPAQSVTVIFFHALTIFLFFIVPADAHRKKLRHSLHLLLGIAGKADPAELPADHRRA